MTPEEEVLTQAHNMNQGMMGFGSMQPPKTDSNLRNFFIQALMQGGMGIGKMPTPSIMGAMPTPQLGVNRGPNMYNPVRHNFMGKPANINDMPTTQRIIEMLKDPK